jgi:hypothetical protein
MRGSPKGAEWRQQGQKQTISASLATCEFLLPAIFLAKKNILTFSSNTEFPYSNRICVLQVNEF